MDKDIKQALDSAKKDTIEKTETDAVKSITSLEVDPDNILDMINTFNMFSKFVDMAMDGSKKTAGEILDVIAKDYDDIDKEALGEAFFVILSNMGISQSAYEDLLSEDEKTAQEELKEFGEVMSEANDGDIEKTIIEAILEKDDGIVSTDSACDGEEDEDDEDEDTETDNTFYKDKGTCMKGRVNPKTDTRRPVDLKRRKCVIGVSDRKKGFWRMPTGAEGQSKKYFTLDGEGKKTIVKVGAGTRQNWKRFGAKPYQAKAPAIAARKKSMAARKKFGLKNKKSAK